MMTRPKLLNPPLTILPLENGDRLNRAEFERRYTAMPEVKKAELIEGMVYIASPLRFRSHGKPHAHIMTWLGTYEAATPSKSTDQLSIFSIRRLYDRLWQCRIWCQTNWTTDQDFRRTVGCKECRSSGKTSVCLSKWSVFNEFPPFSTRIK